MTPRATVFADIEPDMAIANNLLNQMIILSSPYVVCILKLLHHSRGTSSTIIKFVDRATGVVLETKPPVLTKSSSGLCHEGWWPLKEYPGRRAAECLWRDAEIVQGTLRRLRGYSKAKGFFGASASQGADEGLGSDR
ncbi:hypothetical protein BS47DRAFT_1358814 [Hydnum rufescens UP504]|uniref:Uncharacterized protein n=1 Tax=Hydnum rufescens UP504 TaxID=1448309 RepID=A0A9P6B6W8_9AGAM|nr:hypothetical protein BS47DRAFT_1358814 [Hydnum rufescens UP504]